MTLPSFLLAIADKGLLWRGSKRTGLPPVNVRWSLRRFLLLVVAIAAVGTALGGALSLLATGRLLGWAMWLLGLYSTCVGIVVIGLTALCWNQRVSRLRANPNLPLGLPPSRFRLGRWALGFVYLALLVAVTPLAMVVTIENVRGQLAWKHERARLVAQGERLTFRELCGPEIPVAQNAGAAPVFAPYFDYASVGGELTREAVNAIARIRQALFLPRDRLPDYSKNSPDAPKRSMNMGDWSAAYRKMVTEPAKDDPPWAATLKLPPPGDAARDVLAGLAEGNKVMADICAAAARPRSGFPVQWERGFYVSLEHLAAFRLFQQNLWVRGAAHLAAGDTDAAFADATNALNVAELLREEPLLISQLVRFAQGQLATSSLWEGMVAHRWTDAQLAVFQERLGRVDYLSGMILGLEGERVVAIRSIDDCAGRYGYTSSSLRRAVNILPLGMLRQNQVALVRTHTALITDLRRAATNLSENGFTSRKATPLAVARIESQPSSPFTVMAKLIIPTLTRAEAIAARAQTVIYMAIAACALERHRLAHGGYPETLDALVPAFMSKPLPDPMSGMPFHYRRTTDGWFLLYSVGEDGKDDGGVFRAKKGDPIKDWPWPVPTRAEAGSLF